MKKLLALLKAPMRRVIALGAVILGAEFLIMLLIEIGSTYLTSIPQVVWMLLDPIVLAMIAVPVLYIMIWHPMNKQLVELAFQNEEKEKRAAELVIANKELAFQNEEKEKRAAELVIANKELAFQNEEKEKRAAELVTANKELAFQNEEKEKRAAELVIANKELAFQNEEKEKRATELNNLAFYDPLTGLPNRRLLMDRLHQAFTSSARSGQEGALLFIDLDNFKGTIATMNALHEIGILFSLDDFGTGYSSLQYLKRLPLDQLKIDQSFICDIATNSSDKVIVRAIIAMAHSLDLDVIAEGVETEEQRQILLNKDCIHYQGYLFSKPVPIEQFEALLRQG